MKPNKKIIDLIENGFSYKTISKLTPKQLEQLHSRIVKEQTTTNVLKVPKGTPAEKDAQNKRMVYMTYEGELEEKTSKKTKSKNPWAICTSSLSDEFGTSERSEWTKSQLKKYEKCVMGVKEKMNEGKNPFEVILENKITQLIEKHVHPKMTKKDFLEVLTKKMIQETKTKEPKIKPGTKPTTKPGTPYTPKPGPQIRPKANAKNTEVDESDTKTKPTTKPGTKPTTKPGTPYTPKPGPNPKPKAKKTEVDESDTKTKPTTKPGTKPTTKPGHPYSPKPGPNPGPKARKGNIPDWFTFDKLGLKIK